jgi:hypothetical protein
MLLLLLLLLLLLMMMMTLVDNEFFEGSNCLRGRRVGRGSKEEITRRMASSSM